MKRRYGFCRTHLHLTEKAKKMYPVCDPLTIEEVETSDGYLYNCHGVIDGESMTAQDVIDALEDLSDELSEMEMES